MTTMVMTMWRLACQSFLLFAYSYGTLKVSCCLSLTKYAHKMLNIQEKVKRSWERNGEGFVGSANITTRRNGRIPTTPNRPKRRFPLFSMTVLHCYLYHIGKWDKALPFFKNFATGGHSYVFDHHIFVSLCHFFSSSSLLLPLSVNVFILSRWLY